MKEYIKKWRGNASYLVKKLKQDEYRDTERHFKDFTESVILDCEKHLTEKMHGVLENNKNETLWESKEDNEVMRLSIEAYIVAVKQDLINNHE